MRAKLTIDLGVIKANYRYLCTQTKAIVAAAVKGDAYGLGASMVGPALYEAGCRDFFVAHLEEGVSLRGCIPDANIYVLNGPESELNDFLEFNLIPVLNNKKQLEMWDKKSIIHIDTGMNRYGFGMQEFASLTTLPPGVQYLISHIACDSDASSPYNKLQLERFMQATAPHNIKKSIAASGGIFLGNEYHFDMVRPGAALYGIGCSTNPNLKSPISLTSQIIQVKTCAEDSLVGYNSTFEAKSGNALATVPIGYSDGYFRSLGNKSHMYVNGKKARVVGIVSMDLSVLDVTGINCQVGDKVEVFGAHVLPDHIAPLIGTVSYELLTTLMRGRYVREYIKT